MIEKKSMLCPNCRRLISNDEPACPYCGMSRPGALWKRTFAGVTSLRRLDPVMAILIVNGAFFLLSILINPAALGLSANPLTFLSPSDGSLFLLGATGSLPIAYGRWWTLISASFLHGGILHIFFNMMALRQLAPFVLDAFGLYRFAILYVWTGVAGFFLSYLAGIPFTIGASAPICGLIGAILYYGKSRGGFYGEAIYRQAMDGSWDSSSSASSFPGSTTGRTGEASSPASCSHSSPATTNGERRRGSTGFSERAASSSARPPFSGR